MTWYNWYEKSYLLYKRRQEYESTERQASLRAGHGRVQGADRHPQKSARPFGIEPGDSLVLVGDEKEGLAIITNERVSRMLQNILKEDADDDSDPND